MITKLAHRRAGFGLLLVVLLGTAAPVLAQNTTDAEVRIRKLEAEVRALQRQVFPGSDGKFFTPEVSSAPSTAAPVGTPATTPVSDLLTRMEAVEAQISRLTAQNEETANRVARIEARLAAITSPDQPPAPAAATAVAPPVTTPAPAPVAVQARPTPAPAPVQATPSAARVAAVKEILKPNTGDAGEDEYTYGFRLWDAKFYPEAQQQLRSYVDKYPNHSMISYGRNLLGRAYLDDGKPREAAGWFVQNYQSDKQGRRAPDSLLYLGKAMYELKDTSRACIALAEFSETYPGDAAGRLKDDYEALRKAVKCK